MLRGTQNKSIFLLIAVGCVWFPLSAWSASIGDDGSKNAAELKPVETKAETVMLQDKFKPVATDRAGAAGKDGPLEELTVSDVKACRKDQHELNLPGSIIVALPAGAMHRMELRKQKKPPKVLLGLVLNGIFMEGIFPQHVSSSQDGRSKDERPQADLANGCSAALAELDRSNELLLFRLAFNTRYRAAWEAVLIGSKGSNVSVSVGFNDGEVMFSDQTISIKPSRQDWAVSAALAVLLIVGFIVIILKSYMLTEAPDHVGYSLGRTQMAWWTGLTVWGFFFIYQYTGTADLTNSMVVLMGISSATALGAVLIDKDQKREDQKKEDQKKEPIVEAGSKPCVPQRNHFFAKLLSDPGDSLNDYSLHRVQIFCWNLVMSYVFLHSVVINYTMPEFDSALLGLMGVSSAAYLGFKRQEQSVAVSVGTGSAA
jgi:hypothetical protein